MEGKSLKCTSYKFSISPILFKAVVVIIIVEGLVRDTEGTSNTRLPQPGDSAISPFGVTDVDIERETARRMRDKCGRYSLLRVLQQWENLQKRCRLSLKDTFPEEERSRYEYIMSGNSPPSPDDIDDINIGKRSRHHFYSAVGQQNRNGNGALEEKDDRFQNNYYEVNGDALDSCCPVVFEVIAPVYGRMARTGHMVELYKDENVQQKFYEYRCHKDYLEQPCRYVDNQHRKISKCVQQYLDTYALVRSENSATGWSMENIRIASGCACKVDPKKGGRRRKKISLGQSQRNYEFFRQRNNNKNRRREFQPFRSSIIDY